MLDCNLDQLLRANLIELNLKNWYSASTNLAIYAIINYVIDWGYSDQLERKAPKRVVYCFVGGIEAAMNYLSHR